MGVTKTIPVVIFLCIVMTLLYSRSFFDEIAITSQDAQVQHRGGCVNITEDHKFFLFELEAEQLCYSGEELLDLVKQTDANKRHYLGIALFMKQQLRNHPLRTLDPSEATLFVVSPIFDITTVLNGPMGCKVPIKRVYRSANDQILASPYYQRNQGKDFLISFYDWRVKEMMLDPPRKPSAKKTKELVYPDGGRRMIDEVPSPKLLESFQHTVRNMLVLSTFHAGGMRHGEFVTGKLASVRSLVVPELAPSALDTCSWNAKEQIVECAPGTVVEETYEEYRAARNTTLFFIGNGHRTEAAEDSDPNGGAGSSKASYRNLAIYHMSELRYPAVLADTSPSKHHKGKDTQECNFDDWSITTSCRIPHKGIPAAQAVEIMSHSLLSLHIRGNAAGSSRIYESISSGTPQLFLSPRFMEDAAPFKCTVPWSDLFETIDEQEFEEAPLETMEAVLTQLLEDYSSSPGRLEQIWKTQQVAAKDLLWHVPGSRVAENMIRDAMQMVLLSEKLTEL